MNARYRRILVRFLKIIFILYITGGILLYFIQDQLLFHPTVLPADHSFNFSQPFEELSIPFSKNNLSLLKFKPQGERKGIVLFFHGNSKNVEHYGQYPEIFTSKGYECWMADYPGFGKSTGRRSEQMMYEQAALIYRLAAAEISSDHIIIYGKSIGTGVASWLASQQPSKYLILETPYQSITALARHYFPIYPVLLLTRYRFPVSEYLKNVKSPVIIFHGTKDRIIPYRQARKLADDHPEIELITIEHGQHNDLAGFENYRNKINLLLSN